MTQKEVDMNSNIEPRAQWRSMTSYLLVTTGAVVGLGNIIRFPFYIYSYGSTFFLFYIFCELFICIPILFAELMIGRSGKQNPVGSFSILALETKASQRWRWIGWLGFVILFLSLASYTVSVAFPAAYFTDIFKAVSSSGLNKNMLNDIGTQITGSFVSLEICFLIFLTVTMLVVLRGINRGLETLSRITVPLYFIILLGLAIYSCTVGNISQACSYLFDVTPDVPLITVFFTALTYAFFKLNVGMGSMIVYGSYLPYSVPIGRSTFIVVVLDAIVSLLSYFVIYPLFSPAHVAPSTIHNYQETLFFFLQAPNGDIIALLFFLTAVIAAWTPTIAMAESATVTLIERFNLSRPTATLIVFVGAILVGTAIALSHHAWSNIRIFNDWTIASFIDDATSNVMIPLCALLTSIFAGWVLNRSITQSELNFKNKYYVFWRFLVRYVAPISIAITVLMLFKAI